MSLLPLVLPNPAWGVALAFTAMLIYGVCMVMVSAFDQGQGLGSGPGSMLAALAGIPVGLLLAGWRGLTPPGIAWPDGEALVYFILAGIASTYLGRWLVFRSIELVGPGNASGLQSTSPLITAAFGWVFLNEALDLWGMTGIGLGIAGLLLMSMGVQPTLSPAGQRARGAQRGMATAALLVGLGSACAYSASHIWRAAAVRQWNEPLLGAAIGALAGTLALVLGCRSRWGGYVAQARAHPRAAGAYVAAGALQLMAQALVIASMKFIPAGVTALVSMCTPLAVMPLSFLLLRNRERLRQATAWGICITLAGIALVVLFGDSRS